VVAVKLVERRGSNVKKRRMKNKIDINIAKLTFNVENYEIARGKIINQSDASLEEMIQAAHEQNDYWEKIKNNSI
jgi:uncharacterized protein YggL (DUF469 family)